jgi:RNA-directed DNA polymerase
VTSSKFKWKNVNWQTVRLTVARYQERIYKASKEKNLKKVYILQRAFLQSFDAKLMAVRRATENLNLEKPPVIISHTQKIMLVFKLSDGFISSTSTPLDSVSVVEQRAKQMLAKQALEPQWEAFFEPNCYSLKKNHYDLVHKTLSSLKKNKPQWVFRIDFANVSEITYSKVLTKLATFPEMEKQIQLWLKKGILVDFEKRPDLLWQFLHGESLNCFSDFLVNVAFHGLENFLSNWYSTYSEVSPKPLSRSPITVVRYKTSFMITTEDKTIFDAMDSIIDTWCKKEIGFLPSKKNIYFSSQGFEYLGFQFISIKQKTGIYRMKVRPSKNSKQRFIQRTRDLIQKNKAVSSYVLIRLLSRPILGWANYFYFSDCKKDFSQLDAILFNQIRAWVFRRKSKGLASRTKLKQKYFPEGKRYFFQGKWYQQNWILNGQIKDQSGQLRTIFLPKMVWVSVSRMKCY